jgi:hypothetical protein
MPRTVTGNRVTTGDLKRPPGGLSIGRNFRIVRMCSKVLLRGLDQ